MVDGEEGDNLDYHLNTMVGVDVVVKVGCS